MLVLAFLSTTGDFYAEQGSLTGPFTLEATGVSSIALAEGTTPSSGLMGYLSINGSFFVSEVSLEVQWTLEARGVAAISLAAVGPTGEPLLGYLAGSCFYAAEGLTPATWVPEATGVAEMAVASDSAPGASPVLGYVTITGNPEVLQGQPSSRFSLQASDVSSLALSSVTDS